MKETQEEWDRTQGAQYDAEEKAAAEYKHRHLQEEFNDNWNNAPESMTFSVGRRAAQYWWTEGRRAEVKAMTADITAVMDRAETSKEQR